MTFRGYLLLVTATTPLQKVNTVFCFQIEIPPVSTNKFKSKDPTFNFYLLQPKKVRNMMDFSMATYYSLPEWTGQKSLSVVSAATIIQTEKWLKPETEFREQGWGSRMSKVECRRWLDCLDGWSGPITLGVPSPFFPGILLSRKPPETRGKRIRSFWKERRLKKMDKESTSRVAVSLTPSGLRAGPLEVPLRMHGFSAPRILQKVAHLSYNQNSVLEWSTQNHASRIKKADIRSYLWLGLALTNLHLPGCSLWLTSGQWRCPRVWKAFNWSEAKNAA